MLPHPDTARRIIEFHDQERLRDVAQQRRATSLKGRTHSGPTKAGSAQPTRQSRLTGWSTAINLAEYHLGIKRDRSPKWGTAPVARPLPRR